MTHWHSDRHCIIGLSKLSKGILMKGMSLIMSSPTTIFTNIILVVVDAVVRHWKHDVCCPVAFDADLGWSSLLQR